MVAVAASYRRQRSWLRACRPAVVATAAGDDGVDVAGLDAVRRKTVLRRGATKRSRRARVTCVGRSPAARWERGRRRCRRRWGPPSCSARRGFDAVSCVSSNGSRACQRKRSISALRENVLAALAAPHAAQHVGLAALLDQVEQARIVKRRPRPLRARSAAAAQRRPSSTCRAQRSASPTWSAASPRGP